MHPEIFHSTNSSAFSTKFARIRRQRSDSEPTVLGFRLAGMKLGAVMGDELLLTALSQGRLSCSFDRCLGCAILQDSGNRQKRRTDFGPVWRIKYKLRLIPGPTHALNDLAVTLASPPHRIDLFLEAQGVNREGVFMGGMP